MHINQPSLFDVQTEICCLTSQSSGISKAAWNNIKTDTFFFSWFSSTGYQKRSTKWQIWRFNGRISDRLSEDVGSIPALILWTFLISRSCLLRHRCGYLYWIDLYFRGYMKLLLIFELFANIWVNRNFIVQFNFFNLFSCTFSSYDPISNFFLPHTP